MGSEVDFGFGATEGRYLCRYVCTLFFQQDLDRVLGVLPAAHRRPSVWSVLAGGLGLMLDFVSGSLRFVTSLVLFLAHDY